MQVAAGREREAGTVGLGKRTAARAALMLCRVISSRPTSAPAAAVATARPLVVRNRRRTGHPGKGRGHPGWAGR